MADITKLELLKLAHLAGGEISCILKDAKPIDLRFFGHDTTLPKDEFIWLYEIRLKRAQETNFHSGGLADLLEYVKKSNKKSVTLYDFKYGDMWYSIATDSKFSKVFGYIEIDDKDKRIESFYTDKANANAPDWRDS